MTFPAATLKTGETRNAYVMRRHNEGATPTQIRDEINDAERLPDGTKPWSLQVVVEIIKKTKPRIVREAVAIEKRAEALPEPEAPLAPVEEPPLLTEERKAELAKKALERVRAEMTKEAEDAFLKEQIAVHKKAMKIDPGSGEDLVEVHMNLAEFQPYIQLDMPQGPCFYHGQTYRVRRRVASVLLEQMARGHDHQAEIDGKSKFKNRQRSTTVSGIHGIINERSQFRV